MNDSQGIVTYVVNSWEFYLDYPECQSRSHSMKLTPDLMMDLISAYVLIQFAFQDPHGALIAACAYGGTLALGAVANIGHWYERSKH